MEDIDHKNISECSSHTVDVSICTGHRVDGSICNGHTVPSTNDEDASFICTGHTTTPTIKE